MPGNLDCNPPQKISALNNWIKEYAGSIGATYLDFYTPMADARGGMKTGFSSDGVHPNLAGYAIMDPLAEKAIAEALSNAEALRK